MKKTSDMKDLLFEKTSPSFQTERAKEKKKRKNYKYSESVGKVHTRGISLSYCRSVVNARLFNHLIMLFFFKSIEDK